MGSRERVCTRALRRDRRVVVEDVGGAPEQTRSSVASIVPRKNELAVALDHSVHVILPFNGERLRTAVVPVHARFPSVHYMLGLDRECHYVGAAPI